MQNTVHVNIDLTLTLHLIQICTTEALLSYHLISLHRMVVQVFPEGKYKQMANESTWFKTSFLPCSKTTLFHDIRLLSTFLSENNNVVVT